MSKVIQTLKDLIIAIGGFLAVLFIILNAEMDDLWKGFSLGAWIVFSLMAALIQMLIGRQRS